MPPKPEKLLPRDLKRAASHLQSRATWLERRREPDPRCRAAQLHDAADCARLADILAALAEAAK